MWLTAEKTWQRSFALFVAVKHCGRFIIKGNRFYTDFQSNRKVKRKWPIGGRLWILFWSIWLKIKAIVCVIIVAWNSVVNRPLVTSCEILVASAKFFSSRFGHKFRVSILAILVINRVSILQSSLQFVFLDWASYFFIMPSSSHLRFAFLYPI